MPPLSAKYLRYVQTEMRGRSVIVVAAVLAATGVAIVGSWWIASDEGGGPSRPATTMTPGEAARGAASFVRYFEARRRLVPVLHCKFATPRQRYWCGSARRLTADVVAAELLRPPGGSHGFRCVVEKGDLWTIDAGLAGCPSWG